MTEELVRVSVLVVCAQLGVCDALARLLHLNGFDVQSATGPAEATGLLDGHTTVIIELDGARPPIVAFVLAARSHQPPVRILGLGVYDLENVKLDARFPLPVDPHRILDWLSL